MDTETLERITSKAWAWLNMPPGHIRMTWVELKAAVNEFAESGDIVNSLIAAAYAGERN